MQTLKIGLLGLGQVGSGLYRILTAKKAYFEKEIGVSFQIRKIAVKNLRKKRSFKVKPGLLTDRPLEIIRDPEIDVVVELIGGTQEAGVLARKALQAGKHLVTANKALLAEQGDAIFDLAMRQKRWIAFEASVGGGIPVIKALREGLVANRLQSVHSIINGTSNYILSKMSAENLDFEEALRQAQKKGYAEANPRFDIEGIDAAHKLALLVRLGFGGKVDFKDIYHEGISCIRKEDIAFAREFGYRIKLLAIAKASNEGIEARVQPTLLPASHILANVNGAFNAVLMHGDEVGDVLLYGQGAGPHPTASAVVSDLADIAKRGLKRFEGDGFFLRGQKRKLKIRNISSILSRYYLRFHVIDQPGVLAKISKILGQHKISISDCVQKETSAGKVVPLILMTHDANESDVRAAIQVIDRLAAVRGKSQLIRIEGN